jgi:hypothetical protein
MLDKNLGKLIAAQVYGNCIPLAPLLGKKGNRKVPKTTAIFNMGSATDCPSKALGLCAAINAGVKCYAEVAEYLYPQPLQYRRRQEQFWKNVTAEQFALQFMAINSCFLRKPFDSLRFSESGDFWSQDCVDKVETIARILKPYGIVTYGYTSRSDLSYKRLKALKLSGSDFKTKGVVNIFKIIQTKEDKPKGYGLCPMDCHICTRCRKSGIKTAVLSH